MPGSGRTSVPGTVRPPATKSTSSETIRVRAVSAVIKLRGWRPEGRSVGSRVSCNRGLVLAMAWASASATLGPKRGFEMGRSSRFLSSAAMLVVMLTSCFGVHIKPAGPNVGHRIVALVGGTVYPAAGASPIPNGIVVVEGDRIAAVGSRGTISPPRGADIIDVSGSTVLPAFWNSHVHFIEPKWTDVARMDAARVDSLLGEMFTRFGFVYVFDVSSFPEVALPLRDRIRNGQVHGPDVLTTLMGFVPPDGTPRYVPFRMPELSDARIARDSVRARMAVGADGTKLFTVPITRREPFPVMPLEVVRAAVEETHASGKRVFVHPTNAAGVAVAVTAGADILAHTVPSAGTLPDSLLQDMQRRGVAMIPTLTLWEEDFGSDTTGMGAFVRAAEAEVRAFAARGGRILFGTDVGYISRYDPTREYELMAEAGLDFGAILSSLTTAPAEEFGFGARQGRLAARFDADIVVIDGDPVRDIRALAKVRFTFKRGQVLYSTPRTRAP